jgi:hypothetical protein
LATDQGLLRAPRLSGPWQRSEAPAGRVPVHALALTSGRDGLLAAGPEGLLHGAPVLRAQSSSPAREELPGPAQGAGPSRLALRAEPGIRAVQAASLRYLDLGPERVHTMNAGLERRGWLPALSLRLAAARDRRWGRDYDESFLSGDMRRLNDHDRDKSLDLEASLVMTWDLGSLAFDEDAIDISREHRLIVSLRDSVIDEVNQLYFERRSLLDKLQVRDSGADVDRRALELRAAELAAGLDAWTGGWFSREGSRASSRTSVPASHEPSREPSLHPPIGQRPNPEERP